MGQCCLREEIDTVEVPQGFSLQEQPNILAGPTQHGPRNIDRKLKPITNIDFSQNGNANPIVHPNSNNPPPQNTASEEMALRESARLTALKQKSIVLLKKQTLDENSCDICYEQFDLLKRWPLEVCQNYHYICDECVRDFEKLYLREPFPCPFCRLLVFQHEVRPCSEVLRKLSQKQDFKGAKPEEVEIYRFAFQHQLYEIASAFKENRLPGLEKMEQLRLQDKNIEQFAYFGHFKRTAYMQLQNNRIFDGQSLAPLSRTLQIINISHNRIAEMEWIKDFNQLEILAAEGNNITNLSFLKPILNLKQLFMIGNKLTGNTSLAGLQTYTFKRLQILSIESENEQIETYLYEKISSGQHKNLPQVHTIVITKQSLDKLKESKGDKDSTIAFIGRDSSDSSSLQSSSYLPIHLDKYYKYGHLFHFQPDLNNPHANEYLLSNNTLLKLSSNFTALNSSSPVPREGKQTLQFKLGEKNTNIMMGICSDSIKYSSSVYSKEFIGITFWGNYYNQSNKIFIDCDLRIQKDSVITMVVDFYKFEISWLIDSRLIARLQREEAFLGQELYFVVGVRDNDLSLQFMI